MKRVYLITVVLFMMFSLPGNTRVPCSAETQLRISNASGAYNVRTGLAFKVEYDNNVAVYSGAVEKGDLIAASNAGRDSRDAEFFLVAGEDGEVILACDQWRTYANNKLVSAVLENEQQLKTLLDLPDNQLVTLSHLHIGFYADNVKTLLERLPITRMVLSLGLDVSVGSLTNGGIFPQGLRIAAPVAGLESLTGFGSIKILHIEQFMGASAQLLSQIPSLRELTMRNIVTENGLDIPGLPSLARLTISGGEKRCAVRLATPLPLLSALRLESVKVSDLAFLESAPSLSILDMRSVSGLSTFSASPAMRQMKELRVENCPDLFSMEGVGAMASLLKVFISTCGHLSEIMEIANLKNLTSLAVTDCPLVGETPVLRRLEEFRMTGCSPLLDISFLRSTTSLRTLVIECGVVEDYSSLWKQSGLTELGLINCTHMKNFSFLDNMKSLRTVRIVNNANFKNEDIARLPSSIAYLRLEQLDGIKSLDGLSCAPTLRSLRLEKCASMNDYKVIGSMKQLDALELFRQKNLQSLPCNQLDGLVKLVLCDAVGIDLRRFATCAKLYYCFIWNPGKTELDQIATLKQLQMLDIYIPVDRDANDINITALKGKMPECTIKVVVWKEP